MGKKFKTHRVMAKTTEEVTVLSMMKTRSLYVYSTLTYEKSFLIILKLVVTFTVVIFGQI